MRLLPAKGMRHKAGLENPAYRDRRDIVVPLIELRTAEIRRDFIDRNFNASSIIEKKCPPVWG